MSKLDEILNAVWSASGKYWAGKSHYQEDTVFMTTEEAKLAIIELMKWLLIKPPFGEKYKDCPAAWVDVCYKKFNEEVISNIEKL